MRSIKALLFASVVALLSPLAAVAVPICPALTGADSSYYTQAAIVGDNCNTVITVNPDGSLSVASPNTHPYDGSEDQYVGILNLSDTPLSSLSLSSGTDIFGFDGDGIDAYGIAGNTTDTSKYGAGAYGGPNAFFTAIGPGGTSGVVNFIIPIDPNGGTGYFSLEEAPTTGGGIVPVIGGAIPEPRTFVLLITGVLGMAGNLRRRFARN